MTVTIKARGRPSIPRVWQLSAEIQGIDSIVNWQLVIGYKTTTDAPTNAADLSVVATIDTSRLDVAFLQGTLTLKAITGISASVALSGTQAPLGSGAAGKHVFICATDTGTGDVLSSVTLRQAS